MAGYDSLYRLLKYEINQRAEEGCPADRNVWRELRLKRGADDIEAIGKIYDELMELEPESASESTNIEAIRANRPPIAAWRRENLNEREIFDGTHGGWLGRCCGLTLGKPFETPPFTEHPQGLQRHDIRMWVEKAGGRWPLEFYAPATSGASKWGVEAVAPECRSGNIRRVEPDERVEATSLALDTLRRVGRDFQSADVALAWLAGVTFERATPAQTQALVNMTGGELFVRRERNRERIEALDWSRISTRRNPFREWNDAMQRADVYGWVCPGDPERAAEMAWRDARVSHVKNGVYAAMFMAAAIATAYVEKAPAAIVARALGEIPKDSRLARATRSLVELHESGASWEKCCEWIMECYGASERRHAIPNVLICVLALLQGEGDFGRSVGLAVGAGLCPATNGAATGSILGVALGARAMPARWVRPLNNMIAMRDVLGVASQMTITDAARRTVEAIGSQ